MKKNGNGTWLLLLAAVVLAVVFWPSISANLGGVLAGQGEVAREIVITIVNQTDQAQNVIMPEMPAINPQPVQQAAPGLTPGQLADCAYAQAAGLPAAGCPANAGEMLGTGR